MYMWRRASEREREREPPLWGAVKAGPLRDGSGVSCSVGGGCALAAGGLRPYAAASLFRQTGVSRAPSVADKYLIGIGIGLVSAASDSGKV